MNHRIFLASLKEGLRVDARLHGINIVETIDGYVGPIYAQYWAVYALSEEKIQAL
jgi:hypothetical protein